MCLFCASFTEYLKLREIMTEVKRTRTLIKLSPSVLKVSWLWLKPIDLLWSAYYCCRCHCCHMHVISDGYLRPNVDRAACSYDGYKTIVAVTPVLQAVVFSSHHYAWSVNLRWMTRWTAIDNRKQLNYTIANHCRDLQSPLFVWTVKNLKASHTRYRALDPELIQVYRQSARR